ncbi:MAG: TlpA family protein disulfide reductase [Bacteroidales bacterium]|nr:TlpA family protein disulfide reductase [Bacteroidales bacterium]
MKYWWIIFPVLCLVLLFSCSRHTSLEVDVTELRDGEVYVVFADPDQINQRQQQDIAHAEIKDGKVNINLDSINFNDKFMDCTLTILSQETQFTVPLPLEKGKNIKVTITGIKEYMAKKESLRVSYSGSKQAEDFSEFWQQINDSFMQLAKGENENTISQKQVQLCKEFLKNYPHSAFPYTLIIGQIRNIDNANNPLLKFCEELSSQKSENKWHNFLIEIYKEKVRRDIVAKKMVFSATDSDNKTFSERDFADKVTLLHFWAVQSPKSLEVIKNVQTIYSKYHNKGLEIVSICIDPNPSKWVEWSGNNTLAWHNLFSHGEIYTQRYGFNDIPFYMLFDKQGNIVAKSNVIEELEQNIISLLR